MRKEFIVERQGKAFCLYAGLLDLAHQQGLASIETELVQVPNETNNFVAICTATVTLIKEGSEKRFKGIGDASNANVSQAMRHCLIRMAETRAKARALRDAVNIGVAAFEELGEEDSQDGAPERGYGVGSYRPLRSERNPVARNSPPTRSAPLSNSADSPNTRTVVMATNDTGEATSAQLNAIRNLCKRHAIDPDVVVRERYSLEALERLTGVQAGELIKEYSNRAMSRVY